MHGFALHNWTICFKYLTKRSIDCVGIMTQAENKHKERKQSITKNRSPNDTATQIDKNMVEFSVIKHTCFSQLRILPPPFTAGRYQCKWSGVDTWLALCEDSLLKTILSSQDQSSHDSSHRLAHW